MKLFGIVSRSLRHFRRVAAEIRQGRARHFTFAARDVPLELASVAADFDALQNTQFPERGQETANQDCETDKIHACPFQDGPPD